MVVIAGGFSYADALGAGRMFALQLEHRVGDVLRDFVAAGEAGDRDLQRLPGADPHRPAARRAGPQRQRALPVRVGHAGRHRPADASGRRASPRSTARSPTARAATPIPTRVLWPPPGRSRCATPATNPNGSVDDIAGVCDASGVVLGLMPHPENHVIARQYPGFTRGAARRARAWRCSSRAFATPRSDEQ